MSGVTTMIRTLCRGIRYRPLPELIGQQTVITSTDHLEGDTEVAFGHLGLPRCRLYRQDDRTYLGQIHKYGLLDLEFEVLDRVELPRPEKPLQFLKDMGLLLSSKDLPEEKMEGDEFGVLEDLFLDLQEDHQYLKVMLCEVNPPAPFGIERAKQWILSNKNPSGTFPRLFEVTDACLANLNGIWFGKHFYL